MNNILYGIKRFIKNKNTVTIFAIILCVAIIYITYNWRLKKATEPQMIPYALVDLAPRTLITEEMVGTRKVPGSVITPNVITNRNQIVGQYVSNRVQVPKDSLFYKDTLLTWDELPSSIYEDIPEGNAIVALHVDINSTYGNSIFEGNYIDLYYSGFDRDKKILVGKFIESIKVLAVTDSKFNSVFEKTNSNTAPAYLIFSVPEDLHKLLKKATAPRLGLGEIFPVPRNADYSKNPKPTRVSSAYIENLIKESTITIGDDSDNNKIVIIDNNINTNDTTSEGSGE